MADVLIIDDDEMICEILSRRVKNLGHRPDTALTLAQGTAKASAGAFDVVFLDVNLPDGNGLQALPVFRKTASAPEVIIITGAGEPDGAELAIRSGAWDYIEKPFSKKEVALQLLRVLQYRGEKQGPTRPMALNRQDIVGNSPEINACLELVARTANSDGNVLILGETGTGKELFARAIHENSPRAKGNFVVVDCTVLPENLVESVLFGHRRGAFTGADRNREGLVKEAHQGTLFLDEVGELPLSIQKAFLRVLQERRFRPVGGAREIQSDFRLVAATNRDLDAMAAAGRFRKDLLYRLKSFTIEIPPLRERKKDIRELAMYHGTRLCERNRMETKGYSPEFFEALSAYDWPGNVRELVNAMEEAVASDPRNPILFPKHLPERIRVKLARDAVTRGRPSASEPEKLASPGGAFPRLKEVRDAALAELERKYFQGLMAYTDGDIRKACRISGLGRARLYELMRQHKVSRPRGR
ncbi:MAG: sigma-54-dependent Fis family transcriptional regulator [Deltaproteobacteria bacterium]|nr:sigma-54-dependent Fis family transcriptional regulator [Deltaproteobacteria bacterium]